MLDNPETDGALELAGTTERRPVIVGQAREEIEAVLSAFRQWLLECEQWREALLAPTDDAAEAAPPVDLYALVGEWTALRQEFRITARGSKAGREQLEQAIGEFQQGLDRVGRESQKILEPLVRDRDRLRDELQSKLDAQERSWIELLLDLREMVARGLQASRDMRAQLGWRRWFLPSGLFGGLLEGHELTLRRFDAALAGRGVQPIAAVDRQVDIEYMKVVDLAFRDDLPDGQVVEIIRQGYTRGGRVIRYAEVRAVAAKQGSEVGGGTDGESEPPPEQK